MSGDEGRLLERAAWWLLLALAAFVPVVVTNTALAGHPYSALTLDAVSLPKVVAIAALGGVGLSLYLFSLVRGEAEFRYHRVLGIVWALVAWAGTSTLFSPSHQLALLGEWQRNEGLAGFVGYAIVLTLTVQLVRSTRRIRALAAVLVGSAALVAAYSLLQHFGADPLSWPEQTFGSRMFATFGNPDLLASFLVIPLLLAAGIMLSGKPSSPLFWAAALAFLLIGVVVLLSLVRGAWLGAVAGLVALAFATWRARPALTAAHAGIALAALTLAAAAVGWSVLHPQEGLTVVERLSAAFRLDAGSVGDRIDTWEIGLRAGLQRPVLGYGPDNFVRAFRLNAGEEWWRVAGHSLSANNAHSLPVQYFVTLGAPGALLAMAAVVLALAGSFGNGFQRGAGASRLLYSSVWCGVVGLSVALMAGVTTPMVVVWLWLGVGVLAAPMSRPLRPRQVPVRAALVLQAAVLLVFAAWGASWLAADAVAVSATKEPSLVTALERVDRATSLDPFMLRYRHMRGEMAESYLWSAIGREAAQAEVVTLADLVVSSFQAAVDADPSDDIANIQLLHAYNQRYEFGPDEGIAEMAMAQAEQVGSTWPMMPDGRVEIAQAELHAGDAAAAEEDARAAVSLDPEFSYAWLTLGEALADQERTDEAREAVEHAVELDPEDPDAARLLEALSEPEQPTEGTEHADPAGAQIP